MSFFVAVFTHRKHNKECIRKPGKSNLVQCIKKSLTGSKIYEDYEIMTLSHENITEYINQVNEALETPDLELEKCR